MRYGIPAALFVAGTVLPLVDHSDDAIFGGASFWGAGIAVLLLNVLHRAGVTGDREREREEAARRHFDEHGRWPD